MMSEYEYLDLIVSMRDSIGFHAMNFIALLFAYLLAGYFAAHLLSRFQAIAVSAFYLILAPMPALAVHEAITDYMNVVLEYREMFAPDEPLSAYMRYAPDAWIIAAPGTIILSLIFMVQSRISAANSNNDH